MCVCVSIRADETLLLTHLTQILRIIWLFSHVEVLSGFTLQLLPDSERVDHHAAVERLSVGHASDARVSMRTATTVR